MDQTKFINSYINNLADQLKAMTLDNIMIKTQLAIANETVTELQAKIAELEAANEKSGKKAKADWEEGSFKKEE